MTHNTAELRVSFINGRWIYEVVNLTNFTLTNALPKNSKRNCSQQCKLEVKCAPILSNYAKRSLDTQI